jgi:hypothetical protein
MHSLGRLLDTFKLKFNNSFDAPNTTWLLQRFDFRLDVFSPPTIDGYLHHVLQDAPHAVCGLPVTQFIVADCFLQSFLSHSGPVAP